MSLHVAGHWVLVTKGRGCPRAKFGILSSTCNCLLRRLRFSRTSYILGSVRLSTEEDADAVESVEGPGELGSSADRTFQDHPLFGTTVNKRTLSLHSILTSLHSIN